MKNLHLFCRLVLCCLTAASASGVEITGTVREAAGGAASIVTASQLFPNVGDKVEIFFKIPGGEDEVSVGSGRVSEISADSIKVKIESTSGTVAKDQLARIISANPVRRPQARPATPVSPVTPTAPVVPAVPHAPAVPETPMPVTPAVTPLPPETPGRHVNVVPPGLIPATPAPGAGTTSADDHTTQGLARFNAGDMDGAITHFNEAIRQAPDNGTPYYNRACAYLSKGNNDGVIADTDRALTLGLPNPADAFVMRGTARARKGDVDAAIFDCNRAIKIDPNHALAYNNRANDRLLKRDFKGALEDSNKAATLNPSLALAFYNRGYAHANLGLHDAAIADWNKAIRLQPGLLNELGPQIESLGAKPGRR